LRARFAAPLLIVALTLATGCSRISCEQTFPQVTPIAVTSTTDEADIAPGDGQCLTSSGGCSLRAALQEANAFYPFLSVISLPPGTYPLTIPTVAPPIACGVGDTCAVNATENQTEIGDLDVKSSVCIVGRTRDGTIVSVQNSAVGRAFDVDPDALGLEVILKNITVQNGYVPPFVGIDPSSDNQMLSYCEPDPTRPDDAAHQAACKGGAIRNAGSLELIDTIVEDSAANNDGNGVHNTGPLAISGSIIRDNQDNIGHGGGIYSEPASGTSVVVTNSAIHGNSTDLGGGISNHASGMVLTNTTVSANTAGNQAGGIVNTGGEINLNFVTVYGNTVNNAGFAGNLYSDGGTIVVNHSIVAGSLGAGANCVAVNPGDIVELGASMDDTTGACPFTLTGVDPLLGPLDMAAFDTPIHVPTFTSPAINAAVNCADHTGTVVTSDQVGDPRPMPATGACDLGAREVP